MRCKIPLKESRLSFKIVTFVMIWSLPFYCSTLDPNKHNTKEVVIDDSLVCSSCANTGMLIAGRILYS
jgi:hypothetical protein